MVQRPIAIGLSVCEQVIVEEESRNVSLINCFSRRTIEDRHTAATRRPND